MASVEVPSVYAAPDIIVNSNADTSGVCSTSGTGTCTLRDAITFANTQVDLDNIVFDTSLSGSTITLSSTLPSIDDALTINGSALSSMLTLNGNTLVRILVVSSGQSLTLDTLMVANGYFDGGGAGIYNSGTLTVTNSIFANNRALNSNRGGGIYNNGGTVTITNSTFSGNRSALGGGGGIYNPSGTVTITDSTFTGNMTSTVGGGIFNMGTVDITNSTFSNNLSLYEGGGIYNTGTLTISDDSTFSGNESQGAFGGGLFNQGIATISESTFSFNLSKCYGGGGLYNTSGTVTITRSTFNNNVADICTHGAQGGAIYNNTGAVTVTNSTFYLNTAAGQGGGIYVNTGTLNLSSVTLSHNNAGATNGGGGINYNAGRLNIINTIIANSKTVGVNGGDCYQFLGHLDTSHHNLIEDSTSSCNITNGVNGNIVGVDPVLGPLASNGGDTQTMALLSGSPALDAGDDADCHSFGFGDQRNFWRGQGDHCDIGAFEQSGGIPRVDTSTPTNNGSVTIPNTLTVTFDQDMLHDGSDDAANNITNYLLVERNNNTFDTLDCAGGVQSDDTQISFSNATYNAVSHTATLTLPTALPVGNYRLFVCGTSSIYSVNNIVLNNGEDTEINFTVTASGSGAGGDPSASTLLAGILPATGFAPGRVTKLPAQPLLAGYTQMDTLHLQIPALNVDVPIVGVPRSEDGWDVSWLGKDAGWLNGSAYPTWQGNTVLTGHVWNADNTPGIFVNLKDLQYGDHFNIEAYGQTYTYEVRENNLISKGNVYSAFKHKDIDWVTLLSCEQYDPSSGEYPFRRLVRAVLVNME